jgi:hypothetical protein
VTLDDRLLVGTGEGAVRLLRVQREGAGRRTPRCSCAARRAGRDEARLMPRYRS